MCNFHRPQKVFQLQRQLKKQRKRHRETPLTCLKILSTFSFSYHWAPAWYKFPFRQRQDSSFQGSSVRLQLSEQRPIISSISSLLFRGQPQWLKDSRPNSPTLLVNFLLSLYLDIRCNTPTSPEAKSYSHFFFPGPCSVGLCRVFHIWIVGTT